MVLRFNFALLLTIQFASFFFFFFFYSATILSGPYLWNRYSQRLQIECAALSCGVILHCCLPSNSLCYFFFFFRHDFVRRRVFHLRGIAPRSHTGRPRTCLALILRTPQRSLGNPVTKRCQSPLSHITKSACVRSRERLVCEGGTGARLLGLAYAQLFSSDRVC